MTAADPSNAFALNVNAVSKLKYTAQRSPEDGLNKTSQQFEALFIQKMLHSMRDAIPKSDLLQSSQSDTYQQMMDKQWSQSLSQRGIGLADMLTQQLQNNPAPETANAIEHARPKALGVSEAINAARHGAASSSSLSSSSSTSKRMQSGPALIDGLNRPKSADVPAYLRRDRAPSAQPATRGAASRNHDSSLPDYASKFLARMDAPADRASRETGIPRRVILAQAVLETGWGRFETPAADGGASHNVFNIKATGWNGEVTNIATHEFGNGQRQNTRAGFRVYGSYDQAFQDYSRMMQNASRYAPVRNAPDAETAARQLQASGYATDPAYADKLISIMSQIPAGGGSPGQQPLFDQAGGRPLFSRDQRPPAADNIDLAEAVDNRAPTG